MASDENYLVMKVKIVKEVKRSDGLWRFACGDVLYVFYVVYVVIIIIGTSAFPLQAVPHYNIDFESYMHQVTLLIPYIDKVANQHKDDEYPDNKLLSP